MTHYNCLWEETAIKCPPTSSLFGDLQTDVAIIGAGITGLSSALHLSEKGIKAAVLEAKFPGWGASGRNGGMVIPGLKEDPRQLISLYGPETGEKLINTSGASADLVYEIIARYKIDCEPQRVGWIQAAHTLEKIATLRLRYEQWISRGVDCTWLDGSEISSLVGHDGYKGGWLDRRAGGIQPLSYVHGLAATTQQLGVKIYSQTEVTKLSRTGGNWKLETPNGSVSADKVILATNGYTPCIWPDIKETVIPVISAQVATSQLSENIRRNILGKGEILSDTRRILWYFRQDSDGRLLMGGGGTAYESSLPALYKTLRSRIEYLLPQATQLNFKYSWHGKVALTTDQMPHLHEIAPGFWAALGYNGRGVAMATMMGKVLANKLTDEVTEKYDFPATPVRPIRAHVLRGVGITATRMYYRLLDSIDR